MKKCFFCMVLLFLLSLSIAEASEIGTSVPTNSQYRPGRNYGFQIKCDDIPNITNVSFEWNNYNYTVINSSNTYYYNLSDLAVGGYPYRWIVENTTNGIIFSDTYNVLTNTSSQITLTLNGTAGNRSYRRYNIANFVVGLNILNKTVKLDSTYPSWTTQTNISVLYYPVNLTELGIFTLTASFDGDQNYTSSSRTYYFDSGPPKISGESESPGSPVGYAPGALYVFQINCRDATLSSVWFESNFSGTMKSYSVSSDPPLLNSSDGFYIKLVGLGVRNFSYKWHAKDSLNDESNTSFIDYQILKMNPLLMDVLPSTGLKEGSQVTATCSSINPLEINVSNFNFYKNSELVGNISSTTRMGVFLLSAGTHNFTCTTNGTTNYTNQTVTRTITVLSGPQQQLNITGELKITTVSFPEIEIGKTGEAKFNLVNEMTKNIFNITVDLVGISSDWYNITKPSYIYSGETKEVRINLTIPADAVPKTYSMTINVKGNTSEGITISSVKNADLLVTSPAQNRPPSLSTGENTPAVQGKEIAFSLEWSDDYGLSGYIFSSNSSGVWENDTWISYTGKNGWINITKVFNTTAGSAIAWKIYANDTSNEWSSSDEYTTTVSSPSSDMLLILIIAVIAIVSIVVVIIFMQKRKRKAKKEDVQFVFKKEEAENEKVP